MHKILGSWTISDWAVNCERCRKPRHIYQSQEIRWNVGRDWEDGETVYHCPVCLIKIATNNRTFNLRKRFNLFRSWLTFNRMISPKHYTWAKYKQLFGPK